MTQTASSDLELLRSSLTGRVTGPEDPEYDEARRVWNADIDRRPAAVAHCLDANDVAKALAFAKERRLQVSVRSGAHNMSGAAVVDGGSSWTSVASTRSPSTRRPSEPGWAEVPSWAT
jgi:hypothetical protein